MVLPDLLANNGLLTLFIADNTTDVCRDPWKANTVSTRRHQPQTAPNLVATPISSKANRGGITARKDRGSNMSYILTVRIKQIGYEVGWESTFLPALKILQKMGF